MGLNCFLPGSAMWEEALPDLWQQEVENPCSEKAFIALQCSIYVQGSSCSEEAFKVKKTANMDVQEDSILC